jgi:mannan endo-1,4-beta-mannosidase
LLLYADILISHLKLTSLKITAGTGGDCKNYIYFFNFDSIKMHTIILTNILKYRIMKRYLSFILLIALSFLSCKKNVPADGETVAPEMTYTSPVDEATRVSPTAGVFIYYDDNIVLDDEYQITVNSVPATATVSGKKLTITVTLTAGTVYNISISSNSVKDINNNHAAAVSFSFTTKYPQPTDGKYEAEYGIMSAGNDILTAVSGYSGTGYTGVFPGADDYVTFELEGIVAGRYDLYIGYSTSNFGAKVCNVDINGIKGVFELAEAATFTEKKFETVILKAGNNLIKITPNWTWFLIDYVRIVSNTDPVSEFNIDVNLVTPGASAQAVNVYNYLKTNFLKNIISGTMAAHSTNINEATYVFGLTGKWPALTCFDFIDHTIPNSGSVLYQAPLTLGQEWWNNNGLVSLMWHWRDPLTKTGAFYTANTTFDVSKISDTGSPEYIEMLKDIDTIAVYLEEFRDANIPVIWRPLHEAAGGWFWWGAKGAAPCKALWQLMYDRLVNYHGLNNLIWVWTTNTNTDALDWYPGHNYVDIIGMDIYPGENQHSSQYYEFNRVKEKFEGRKIITLSECGSVPDPKQMKQYGDMWSWFMPWNGDFTRSATHNGPTWWHSIFSNSYVITRDKMPDLH